MTETDWAAWHAPYDEPGSPLHRRLARVKQRISDALDGMPAGPIQVISLCAGQGRDLLEVVRGHPRRTDVSARLVELDARNVAFARRVATEAGLAAIDVEQGDASLAAAYSGAVPADLVLVCGVFGNVTMDDIRTTVENLPRFCASGATVIWTRHRLAPDATPTIRRWFSEVGFTEVAFDTEVGSLFGIGTARLVTVPRPFVEDLQLFTFVGDGSGAAI